MSRRMFDTNGDGKLDSIERAAEMMFIEEVIEREEAESERRSSSRVLRQGKSKSAPTGISFAGKPLYDATKDTPGITIIKSLLVIVLCISGFAIPIVLDLNDLGMAICLFGGVALSMMIMKNT